MAFLLLKTSSELEALLGLLELLAVVELVEKTCLVFVEQPNVINAVADHGDAFNSEAKCPATPDFRIIPNSFKHFRMDHAATGDF